MAGSNAPRPKKNKDTLHNEKWLRQKYLVEQLNQNEIARLLGCSDFAVKWALNKFGIPRRGVSEGKKGRPNHAVWTPEARAALAAKRRGELNPMYGTVSPNRGNFTSKIEHRTRQMGRKQAQARHKPQPCEVCGAEPAERHHVNGNPANNEPENIRFFCPYHHLHVGHGGRWARLVVPEGHVDDRANAAAYVKALPLSPERQAELREGRSAVGKRWMTPERAREFAKRSLAVRPMTSERGKAMSAKAAETRKTPEYRAKRSAISKAYWARRKAETPPTT